jgi:hypothetical protein
MLEGQDPFNCTALDGAGCFLFYCFITLGGAKDLMNTITFLSQPKLVGKICIHQIGNINGEQEFLGRTYSASVCIVMLTSTIN